MLKGILAIVVLLMISGIALFGALKLKNTDKTELITVAIVADESDKIIGSLVSMANDLPSIGSFCSLQYMEEQEAFEGMEAGDIGMIMSIPYDFYEKAAGMQETHITVYVPEDTNVTQKKVLAVVEGIERMMVTTEGAINACYDGIKAGLPVSNSQMEYDLFGDIISKFMNRDDRFDIRFVSPYGKYTFVQYYIISILILTMLLTGVSYFNMYSAGDEQMERILCRGGRDRCLISVVKIASICIVSAVLLSVIGIVAYLICGYLNITGYSLTVGMFISIWLFALSVASFIHLIVAICGNSSHTRVNYWLISFLMLACAGVIVPSVYLPHWIRRFVHILPAGQWQGILLNGIWGSSRRNTTGEWIPYILVTDVIVVAISIIVYSKRLNSHD